MTTVGIIANPASGRDIRRLVAHATILDNDEKVNIVRRVLIGLESVGVEQARIMPDSFGIGPKALDGLKVGIDVSVMTMPTTLSQEDSTRAAALMVEERCGCIITIGGDGTNRAVAKASGQVPLMPISTGTNNAFPTMIEGTIAGMAAGLVARGVSHAAFKCVPRLDVFPDAGDEPGAPDDIALVDVAIYDERFVASRALWDVAKIKEVILTRAEAGNIGLSSIGAHLLNGSHAPEQGLFLKLEPGGQQVLAPIAPGVVSPVSVIEHRLLKPGDVVVIQRPHPYVLAFDGEREVERPPGSTVRIQLNANGPKVVDAHKALAIAASEGVFIR